MPVTTLSKNGPNKDSLNIAARAKEFTNVKSGMSADEFCNVY